jgi:hypothetical protein
MRSTTEWENPGSPRKKLSVCVCYKELATVFCDPSGVFLRYVLENRLRLNANRYYTKLEFLWKAIRWECFSLLRNVVVFLYKISRPHTSQQHRNFPLFVTKCFNLFLALKEHFAGYNFTRKEDSKCATVLWLKQTECASYAPGLTNLPHALTRASNFKGTVLKIVYFVFSVSWIKIFLFDWLVL